MSKLKGLPIVQFRHCRLPSPRSIRLLSLQPSPELSAPLEVTLILGCLDKNSAENCSNYEALSYVWGADAGSMPCLCNGQTLLLTPNCDDALRHLRLADQHRVLWIDAICIDQGLNDESVKERNEQITLMGEVYGGAKRTLCWLGSGEEYTAGVIERLRRIGRCPSKRELRKLLSYDEQLRQQGRLDGESTCLNHIFCHSWHSRVWTLQEVAFSRDCEVICGMETIPWDQYVAAAKFLIYEEFIDELDAPAWKNWISIQIREDMRDSFLHGIPSGGEDDKAITLLSSGLTQPPIMQSRWEGYAKKFVWLSFSILDLFKMLQYASSNNRDPDLPSWVADWQDEDVTLVNPPDIRDTERFKISQNQMLALSPSSGKLHVRGRVLGVITARAENDFATIEFPSGSLPILKGDRYEIVSNETDSLRLLVQRVKLFREWLRLIDGVPPLPPAYADDGENSGEIFHKLVTFNSAYLFNSIEHPFARLYNAWKDILQYPDTTYDLSYGEKVAGMWRNADNGNTQQCQWSAELFQCSVVAAALLTKSASKDCQVFPEIIELLDFSAFLSGNMGDRALVLIRENLLNAIVPGTAFHKAQLEDTIVVLEGAHMPVVLRRAGDNWSFVGPAFVMGFMDGELWPNDDDVVHDLLDFVLN